MAEDNMGISALIRATIAAQDPDKKFERSMGSALLIAPMLDQVERMDERLDRKRASLQVAVTAGAITQDQANAKLKPDEDLISDYRSFLSSLVKR